MPKVSVCIPTYNCGKYIGQAIKSVLNQDFENYELIISDNASTDDTENIVRNFHNQGLTYMKNERNIGYVGNLNRCLELAKGEFIVYLCADDIWYQGFLKNAIDLLEKDYSLVLVHTAYYEINENGSILRDSIRDDKINWEPFLKGEDFFKNFLIIGGGIMPSNCVARTKFLKKVGGFDDKLAYAADTAMWLKLSFQGNVGFIGDHLMGFRKHPNSLSNELEFENKYIDETIRLIDRVFDWEVTKEKKFLHLKSLILKNRAIKIIKEGPSRRLKGHSRFRIIKDITRIAYRYPLVLISPKNWFWIASGFVLPKFVLNYAKRIKRKLLKNSDGMDLGSIGSCSQN